MQPTHDLATEQGVAYLFGLDSLDAMDDEDFGTYDEYEAWRESTGDLIYEHARDLHGHDVDASAFFKVQTLWERVAIDKSALFFSDVISPSGVHVGCIVDTLTKNISTHHGDPVLFLVHLVTKHAT